MADTAAPGENRPPISFNSIIRYMSAKRTEAFMLSIRVMTLFFTLSYLLPFTPFSTANLYKKALLANAAISALRLHQRLPPFRFSRDYLALLLVEDSAHYLLYSIIFITNYPVSLVLLPITLFALLNAVSFIYSMLTNLGVRGTPTELVSKFLEQYQSRIYFTIALTEITLMPTIIFALMAGLVSIFTPLMYYQFLMMRYCSRRNLYNRQAFSWLRIYVENLASSPRCPPLIRTILLKGVEIVNRFGASIQQQT